MNMRVSKIKSILVFAGMLVAFLALAAIGKQIANAEPLSIFANAGEDIGDYPIGQQVTLDGSRSSGPAGSTLYYAWQVVAWPKIDINDPNDPGDPDHHDGNVGHMICQRSTNPRCVIEPLGFFDADDVGTWTVRLTVDDGANYATDDLLITIKGFNSDARWPTHAEGETINPIAKWIDWNTHDFYGLLLYTNIPGVTYFVGNKESGTGVHPDYEHEDRYMQAALVPIMERLAEKAQNEGLRVIITEAWDPPGGSDPHSETSRHLDGRAVDIVPNWNPQDRQRIGRLAYLAEKVVEELGYGRGGSNCSNPKGCVWIFHEHDHLHLSVRGETARPHLWGYRCDQQFGCLPHQYNNNGSYSGAAVGAMILNWQGWSIDEYEFYNASGAEGWDPIACDVLAQTLNKYIDRGWTCMRAQNLDEALRMAAFWIDMTNLHYDGHTYAFPIAIPMNMHSHDGNYNHWVAVDGAIATANPGTQGSYQSPGYGNYTVGAINVVDPSIEPFEPQSQYAKRFITRYELQGNYGQMNSELLPNLGITWAPTGPGNTYELVVPAGCTQGRIDPMVTFAASASSGGTGLFCDSRYSIASPPANSIVTTWKPVRVIATVPNEIGIPQLKVSKIKADGNEEWDSTLIGGKYVSMGPGFNASSVYEFEWTPYDSDVPRYRLTVIDSTNPEISCGTTEVIPSADEDAIHPEVFFFQPFIADGALLRIEDRNPYSIEISARDNQGIQVIDKKDNVKVRMQNPASSIDITLHDYEYCGPACYRFNWDINDKKKWPDGAYQLTAFATDAAGRTGSYETKVGLGQVPPVSIDQFSLRDVDVVKGKHVITITANGGYGNLMAYLEITGPDPTKTNPIWVYRGVNKELLEWNPRENGKYTVAVTVYDADDADNRKTEKKVVVVERDDIISDGEWKRLSPDASPRLRDSAMVDTGAGIYLFGGNAFSGMRSNELWKWDGMQWLNLTPEAPSNWPQARSYPQLAYDGSTGKLILFGGMAKNNVTQKDIPLNDLWEYDISAGTWQNRTPSPIPTNMIWPPAGMPENYPNYKKTRMAYHAALESTLLSIDGDYSSMGMYLWNTGTGEWETPFLGWYNGASIAFDSARNAMVGYASYETDTINDTTLEADGYTWTRVNSSYDGFSPRLLNSNPIGSPFGVFLLGQNDGENAEMWHWEGTRWTKIEPLSGSQPETDYIRSSFVYDSSNHQVVLYAANGETWAYSRKLENLKAFPMRFDDEWPVDSGKKLGTGIELTFDPCPFPNLSTYEVQVSENGGVTWQDCGNCGINLDGIVRHTGDNYCEHGYYYCLKRLHEYSYRIRPLNQAKNPMMQWDYIFNVVSLDWPANVKMKQPNPPGPYTATTTVTLELDPKQTYGPALEVIEWQIIPWGGATASKIEGCGSGFVLSDWNNKCKISISKGSSENVLSKNTDSALVVLEPPASVNVVVRVRDSWGSGLIFFEASDSVILSFSQSYSPVPTVETIFSDVPEDHWATDYIEYLYNHGYISGCEKGDNLAFCPYGLLSRSEMAVVLVRSFHPDQPGYMPDEAKGTSYQDMMMGKWDYKWVAELEESAMTAGCSLDPPLYCPTAGVTRAQMAVFAVKTHRGTDVRPIEPENPTFRDVPKLNDAGERNWQFAWVEQAFQDGLIQACDTDMVNMLFEPDKLIDRATMACMMYYALQVRLAE